MFKSTLLLLAGALFASTSSVSGSCKDGWDQYDGSCYLFRLDAKVKYSAARSACKALGSDMTSIVDADEKNFIQNTMHEIDSKKHAVFIGLKHSGSGFWWSDGTPKNYTNWASGEPNGNGNEVCVEMYVNSGKWNDLGCTIERGYVCKQPEVTEASEPGTCDDGWEQHEESCYLFRIDTEVMGDKAISACQELDANVVSIGDADEQDFIQEQLKGSSKNSVYIGLTHTGSKFSWSDGAPKTYTNWAKGEPNGGGSEDCVEMYVNSGKWNDLTCSTKRGYVCEKPTQPKKNVICSLAKDNGDGSKKDYEQRFYFNASANKCKKFRFTKSGGNANNFKTKQECVEKCY